MAWVRTGSSGGWDIRWKEEPRDEERRRQPQASMPNGRRIGDQVQIPQG